MYDNWFQVMMFIINQSFAQKRYDHSYGLCDRDLIVAHRIEKLNDMCKFVIWLNN